MWSGTGSLGSARDASDGARCGRKGGADVTASIEDIDSEVLWRKDFIRFLDEKTQYGQNDGFDPVWMPSFLFDFQQHLVNWNCRKGRSGTLADCGLGKTPMLLVWAENVVRKTGKRVLILTPLAVAAQTVSEGAKFGIEVKRSKDGRAGRITSVKHAYIMVLFDGWKHSVPCHPTWEVTYHTGRAEPRNGDAT
jgi:hypothetical protein